MGSPLRAVVFDLDGVLVESEHLWEEMWTGYAQHRGVRWGPEDTKTVQGMSSQEWSSYLNKKAAGADETDLDTERAVVDGMVEAFHQGRAPLLPGARDLVQAVSGLVPIALASSAPRRLIDAVLSGHGLADNFTATVSSAEVDYGKPSPHVYLAAAERLGHPGSECAAVEDSSNGLRSAAAAGMTVVALPNPTYPPAPDALANAVSQAKDLDEVRETLLRLIRQPTAERSP